MEQSKNSGFNSKLGVILAAAGSAIGLGNIWKFPYEAGQNGGGAFLIVYLLCVILFGMPLLMTEILLEGSGEGLRFFFYPDFSHITPSVFMEAAGQCFFSLSVGLGLMITYGAYMPKEQDVTKTSFMVILLDTLVAVLAGVIIFPAVFAFGFDPAEGPQLVFVVLPAVLQHMSFAWFSGVAFFTLLFIERNGKMYNAIGTQVH